MKTKLFFLLFAGYAAFAQDPIPNYQGTLTGIPGITYTDGMNMRLYWRLQSASPLDHAASGANAQWHFDGLSVEAEEEYLNQSPTVAEASAFPGATKRTDFRVANNVVGVEFTANDGSAIVALQTQQFALTYTDAADLGTFPMSFGYANTDSVSGTYQYGTYTGTFSGTLTTSVDGYGTMLSDFLQNPVAVVRLKTVQALNVQYSPFGNVGTVVITTYHYYDTSLSPGRDWPFFKSTSTAISIPLLGVNETDTALEIQNSTFLLRNPEFSNKTKVTLSPNPAQDVLNLRFADGYVIESAAVSDLTGKKVLAETGNAPAIDISGLQSGVYLLTLTSKLGSETHRFVKM